MRQRHSRCPQGQVQVQVEDTTGGQQATDAQVVITAPSVSVTIDPVVTRIIRNGPVYFTGYAVGALNAAVTWQVNGVTGGSTTYGTITQAGVYTAPAAVPVGGVSTVSVVVCCRPDEVGERAGDYLLIDVHGIHDVRAPKKVALAIC